VLIRAH
jgi:hypothetical protein